MHPPQASGESSTSGAMPLASTSSRPRGSGGPDGSGIQRDAKWTPNAFMSTGMFAGRNMSFWLEVAQEPVHGRRKTEKDRRPLAPSPIIRLWFKEQTGPDLYHIIDPIHLEASHFICAADLQPTRQENDPPARPLSILPKGFADSTESSQATPLRLSGSSDLHFTEDPISAHATRNRLEVLHESRADLGETETVKEKVLSPTTQPLSHRSTLVALTRPHLEPRDSSDRTPKPFKDSVLDQEDLPHSGVVDYEPLTSVDSDDEAAGQSTTVTNSRPTSRGSDKASARGRLSRGRSTHSALHDESRGGGRSRPPVNVRNLFGNLHVSGIKVPTVEGGIGVWFLFTDLCVRNEGSYSLRFRCFDMTAISGSKEPVPPLVECQTADFKVYSPRNFPGLPKPTELAEHFARQGYKLNTRKNERQAMSPPESPLKRPEPRPVQNHHAEYGAGSPATSPYRQDLALESTTFSGSNSSSSFDVAGASTSTGTGSR